jgi:hypothetical protein
MDTSSPPVAGGGTYPASHETNLEGDWQSRPRRLHCAARTYMSGHWLPLHLPDTLLPSLVLLEIRTCFPPLSPSIHLTVLNTLTPPLNPSPIKSRHKGKTQSSTVALATVEAWWPLGHAVG